jgi:hypothetical protein
VSALAEFTPGGYRYIPGPFQYSGGVAAAPGFRIERVRFARDLPLADGFARVEAHLRALGRRPNAFCACELHSPAPFSEAGFVAFNRLYVGTLERWGLVRGDDNPVARSNTCPLVDPPREPSLHAFCYTLPDRGPGSSFVVAGSGEAPEGPGDYRARMIAPHDVSASGLRRKTEWVVGEMERRLGLLGSSWSAVTATQVYTVHDFHPFVADAIVARGAARHGLTWHLNRPPVAELEFEMDCRGVALERVLPV